MSLMILLLNAAATWFMTGLIWFVQIVHYPLMGRVGSQGYAEYQRRHMTRTTGIVAPVMLIELATALALLRWRPPAVPAVTVWAGIIAVAILWISTAMLLVPIHESLARGFDPRAHRRLVAANWLRTLTWSARAALVVWMLWRAEEA